MSAFVNVTMDTSGGHARAAVYAPEPDRNEQMSHLLHMPDVTDACATDDENKRKNKRKNFRPRYSSNINNNNNNNKDDDVSRVTNACDMLDNRASTTTDDEQEVHSETAHMSQMTLSHMSQMPIARRYLINKRTDDVNGALNLSNDRKRRRSVSGTDDEKNDGRDGHVTDDTPNFRDYAVSTLKELLGIYGLTSDVAESISRQLPDVSFSNVSNQMQQMQAYFATAQNNGATKNRPHRTDQPSDSTITEPPTPPHTPQTTRHPSITPDITVRPVTSVAYPNTTNPNASDDSSDDSDDKKDNRYTFQSEFERSQILKATAMTGANDNSQTSFTSETSSSMDVDHVKLRLDSKISRGIYPTSLADMNQAISPIGEKFVPFSIHRQDSPSLTHRADHHAQNADYSRYVHRFGSNLECGHIYCKEMNFREHFHCFECLNKDTTHVSAKIFAKKEEMIRHWKWHKKRDESLQHGFMRYSPSDDCSWKYGDCQHNRRQTHYHCVHDNCDKTYISTSDVQMHANYHRKDSAIIQEGFQRFRATEDCNAEFCVFYRQRTTHFHCRRNACKYTFKNKADMEKHKTYHIKDEQLARDGFKKFMKTETCPFENCRFSNVCNHIHCIREQCNYVLHSSGQLYSHKRKHERLDSEFSYRKFKLTQSVLKNFGIADDTTDASADLMIGDILSYYHNQDGGIPAPLRDMIANCGVDVHTLNANLNALNTTHTIASKATQGARDAPELDNIPHKVQDAIKSYGMKDLFTQYVNDLIKSYGYNVDAMPAHAKDLVRKLMPKTDAINEVICEPDFMIKDAHKAVDLRPSTSARAMNYARDHDGFERVDERTNERTQERGDERTDRIHGRIDGRIDERIDERVDDRAHQRTDERTNNRTDECADERAYDRANNSTDERTFERADARAFERADERTHVQMDSNDESNDSSALAIDLTGKDADENLLSRADSFRYVDARRCDAQCDAFHLSHFHCLLERCNALLRCEDTAREHGRYHELERHVTTQYYTESSLSCAVDGCARTVTHYHCTVDNCREVFPVDDKVFRRLEHFNMHEYARRIAQAKDAANACATTHMTTSVDGMFRRKRGRPPKNRVIEVWNEYNPSASVMDSPQAIFTSFKLPKRAHADAPSAIAATHLVKSAPSSPGADSARAPDDLDAPRDAFDANADATMDVDDDNDGDARNRVSVVKASGTFYPLSALPATIHSEPSKLSDDDDATSVTGKSLGDKLFTCEVSCSRPFCKLKKKPHYHCNTCNQAFSDYERLAAHVIRHGTASKSPSPSERDANESPASTQSRSDGEKPLISVTPIENLRPGTSSGTDAFQSIAYPGLPAGLPLQFIYQNPALLYQLQQQSLQLLPSLMTPSLLQSGLPVPFSGDLGGAVPESLQPLAMMTANINKRAISPTDAADATKKNRMQSMRILKDEPVPDGYLRFRFNENCQYVHCGYREHQTHFHCQRQDCGYSFCDKTRFVQHTARHERLDKLMGGDFHQYRANVHCGRADCAYANNVACTQNKASHFHCLKCAFVCTDTNKVVAHRRQHSKLDSIQAAGFEKFTPSQLCTGAQSGCQHSGKQTHYHCLNCQYSVLGLAQMSSHKYRHLESARQGAAATSVALNDLDANVG